jgi:hypothetical protein
MFGRKRFDESTYRSYAQVMGEYPGSVKGFYEAIERGEVDVGSDDYQRFYVPRTHACYLLAAIKQQLVAYPAIPKGIELSLARIEGLLAGR